MMNMRAERVGEQMKQEIMDIVNNKVKDPRRRVKKKKTRGVSEGLDHCHQCPAHRKALRFFFYKCLRYFTLRQNGFTPILPVGSDGFYAYYTDSPLQRFFFFFPTDFNLSREYIFFIEI